MISWMPKRNVMHSNASRPNKALYKETLKSEVTVANDEIEAIGRGTNVVSLIG
jgi:hypothetical protein